VIASDYTAAPATALVAARCAACGRALLDAVSVEVGMGPTCRGRAGLDGEGTGANWETARALLSGAVTVAEFDARATANRVVHRIAADQNSAAVPALLAALRALGFAGVESAIREHMDLGIPTVTVAAEGDRYAVTFAGLDNATFAAVVAALRGVPGRRFDGARRANIVPTAARRELWGALTTALPSGAQITGPNGTHTVARRAEAA